MPNVDKCTRECEAGLCDNTLTHAKEITKIPNINRVKILRGKNINWINDFLKNGKKIIQNKIKQDFYRTNDLIRLDEIKLQSSSNNNKVGADLFHILPNGEIIDIEVKFGAETDKNIGQATFAKIFGINCFAEELTPNFRKQMLTDFITSNRDQNIQLATLFQAINRAITAFNNHAERKDHQLASAEQDFMEKELINSSGTTQNRSGNHYLKFILTGTELKDVQQLQTGAGNWLIQPVKPLGKGVSRANVFIFNHQTKTQIKFTLNWKNNYKSNNERFPAKLGFGSSSWNVWISVEITELS